MLKFIRILVVSVELWAHPFTALLALYALYIVEQYVPGAVLTEFPGNTVSLNLFALTGFLFLFGGLRFAWFWRKLCRADFWTALRGFQQANYPALVTGIIVLGFYFEFDPNMAGIIYLPALLWGSAIAGPIIIKRAHRKIAELNGTDD